MLVMWKSIFFICCGVSTERFFPPLLFMGIEWVLRASEASASQTGLQTSFSHPKLLQWLGVKRKGHFTERKPCSYSLLRAQTLSLPFRAPTVVCPSDFMWDTVWAAGSWNCFWGGVGTERQEVSALTYILQLRQWLALWQAELWCNRFSGCVWIAAASQSQPLMCGCEHMAQCSVCACSPRSQACLCLPG